MPLCTLHLLALHRTTPNPISTFLSTLKSSTISPLIISRVIRWIILPSTLSTEHLLARNIAWDLLIILPSTATALPTELAKQIQHHWSLTAGVPSRLLQDFGRKNEELLHPEPNSVAPPVQGGRSEGITGSSQKLELSAELDEWIESFVASGVEGAKSAVSMFNLLAFKPGMKGEYLKYGAAFAESIGSAHGGVAKIVGGVVDVDGIPVAREMAAGNGVVASDEVVASDGMVQSDGDGAGAKDDWDEIALAHYPSILHFRDMLLSEGYQAVNRRFRLPSMRDTCILMTSEVAVEEVGMGKGMGAKL